MHAWLQAAIQPILNMYDTKYASFTIQSVLSAFIIIIKAVYVNTSLIYVKVSNIIISCTQKLLMDCDEILWRSPEW